MRRLVFLALWLCLVPAMAGAEAVAIEQALREAVTARPFVAAARERAVAAESAAGEARSRYLPRVTLGEHLTWTDEPAGSLFISLNQEDLALSSSADRYNFPPARKDFETRLSLEQPLFDPDIAYGRRRAEKGAEAARAGAVWSSEEAAFAAFRAYLEVQRAQAALAWTESSRREAEELLRLTAERRDAGVGLKSDWLRARVQLADAERRQTTVGNDLVIARRGLALAMGRTGEEVMIADPVPAERLTGEEPPLLLRRADLQALRLEADAATLAWRQSRAAWLPRAGLSAAYALHDAELPFGTDAASWTVLAGLEWELFDGRRRAHGQTRAAAEQRAAAARSLEATRQADFRLEEARLRAAESRQNLAIARQAVAEAEESQRLLRERYGAGIADLADLLAAQAALDRARFDAVDAETRLVLALGNIHFQGGTFLSTLLPAEEGTP